jgi:outer membrane protein assembly factor BamB
MAWSSLIAMRGLLITGGAAAAAVLAVAASGCGPATPATPAAQSASGSPSVVAPASVDPCTATAAYAAEVSDAGKVVWQVAMPPGQADGVPSPVVISGIAVFAAESDLTGLRATDGHRLWDFHVRSRGSVANAVSGLWPWDGNAIALIEYSDTDWRVVAINPATGQVRWQFKLTAQVDAFPVLSTDGVLALGADKRIYAVSLANGHLLWSRHLVEPALNGNNTDQLVIADGVLIAAYTLQDPVRSGFLDGFAEKTGAQLWSRTGMPQVLSMQADGSTVFLSGASSDSSGKQQASPLTALSAASGKTIWHASVGYVYAVWTAPGLVIFGSQSGMYDVDPATGARRWRVPGENNAPGGDPSSLAITASDVLYYPNGPNLTDRSLSNGTVAWTQPAAAGGSTFVLTPNGPNAQVAASNNFDDAPQARVYLVDLRTGKLAAPVIELPSDLPAAPVVDGSDVIYQLSPEPCEHTETAPAVPS